jgi:NADH:ubiquinone oxidoreductase subunit
MSFFSRLFIWWENATPGTLLMTRRLGVLVGQDEFGNRYYQTKDGKRRWMIYAGTVDASRVPPDWHGWLHHTFESPPTEAPLMRKAWELDHQPNLTGTPGAWHPDGSLWSEGRRPPATGDYEAWRPG